MKNFEIFTTISFRIEKKVVVNKNSPLLYFSYFYFYFSAQTQNSKKYF